MKSEASHQQPNRSKLIYHLLTSMQDSIPVLPTELITEILSRLLIKCLLKFNCALKSWFSLISSPEFIKIHLRLNANNKEYTHHKLMMSCRTKYNFKDCSLTSLNNESITEAKELDYPSKSYAMDRRAPYGVSIAGSVNGLIFLVIEHRELFLWNPSIRKYKKLPDPRPTLIYFPRRAYGFGYDEFHDAYKVVVFFNNTVSDGSREFEVKIYSLKSDSWRRVDDFPCPVQLYVSGKFLKGKLHWAATTGKSHLATTTTKQIMIPNIISIDLADEKWGEMEQPCNQKAEISLRLGVLGGDLSVSCNCCHAHVDVWVMKEYGVKESWTKMFTLKYPEHRLGNGNLGQICLHMANEGENLL